ncbi:MAG TPA: hypothetical protein VGG71_06265, partial [Chitinophagaceae bacterium]
MLKRKMVRAGLFSSGFILMIASVNGTNQQEPVITQTIVPVDPIVQQLQAFDSSFAELNEWPTVVLTMVPKIKLNWR